MKQAFPKPTQVRSPETLISYRDAHPWCEVIGCDQPSMPTPHHLFKRGLGGGDERKNLLALCFGHHIGNEGWHTLGPRAWLERFRHRLRTEALAKVVAAVGRYKR